MAFSVICESEESEENGYQWRNPSIVAMPMKISKESQRASIK
jgi:hypothetical protein